MVAHGRLRESQRLIELAGADLATLGGMDQREQAEPGGYGDRLEDRGKALRVGRRERRAGQRRAAGGQRRRGDARPIDVAWPPSVDWPPPGADGTAGVGRAVTAMAPACRTY